MEINELLVSILTNLVLLVIALAGGYAIRWLKRHLTAQQIGLAAEIAEIAVRAAEQIGYASGFDGPKKLAEALDRARDLAGKYGIKYSDEQWATLIEKAVEQLKVLGEQLHAKDASAA